MPSVVSVATMGDKNVQKKGANVDNGAKKGAAVQSKQKSGDAELAEKRKRDEVAAKSVKAEIKQNVVKQVMSGKKPEGMAVNAVKADKEKPKKKKEESESEDESSDESSDESGSSSSSSSSESEDESKKAKATKKVEAKPTPVENKRKVEAEAVQKVAGKDLQSAAKKAKTEPTTTTTTTVVPPTKKPKVAPVSTTDPASDAWRIENNISVLGEDCPAPYTEFSQAGFPDYINKALAALRFSKPTPIQAQAWPLALAKRDMIGLAETGSGKTLAFILPAVVHIKNKSQAERAKGPSVLVLAPTRELAQQIEEVTAKSCASAGMKSACIYGGDPKPKQVMACRGAEVIIATPGRLIDLMQEGAVKLGGVTYLVLDEADRMLDMGFEVQINQIMKEITTTSRQTLMFSATWPADVQRLSQKFFKNPIRITIGSENLSGAKRVTQIVEVCEPNEKKAKLKNLLRSVFKDNCRILIFMLYKHTCESMSVELEREGWPVSSIHGNKTQSARNKTLEDFKSGAKPIMIATDVAARGLDIKQVKYVINVEFPLKCEDYVHRIGRTGRAGESGTAYTYFTADDKAHARELVQIIQESGQQVDDRMLALADRAPGIKPKKTVMQQMYGDFAKADPSIANMKATRIVFNEDD